MSSAVGSDGTRSLVAFHDVVADDNGSPPLSADKYIEGQLLLIGPDRLAQYWVGFGHISFFERVQVDELLVPP